MTRTAITVAVCHPASSRGHAANDIRYQQVPIPQPAADQVPWCPREEAGCRTCFRSIRSSKACRS